MTQGDDRCEADRRFDRFLRRFAYVRYDNIETFGERFAQAVKAGAPPRDPFALLPGVGIALERGAVQPPQRACWARSDDGYVITVPEYEQPPAQRFAAWREVFMLLSARRAFPTQLTQVGRERLANRFASVMLMPAEAVVAAARRFATNPQNLAEVLAERFDVSVSAMRKRLYELKILQPRSKRVHLPKEE